VRSRARFPDVPRKAGHYESFYLKAARPGGGMAFWIRHTVHKRPGAEPTASLWFTLFEEGSAPLATKATFPAAELSAPAGAYIEIGGARLEPGQARGEARSEQLEARWDLGFTDPGEPFRHLPRGWLYKAPIPRTKLLSPYPQAVYTGQLTVGDREVEVEGWPGMIGHNWGAEHAERWIWMHGASFADRPPETSFDVALGRIKLGPWTLPWIGNGRLVLDGVEHRLGGCARPRFASARPPVTSRSPAAGSRSAAGSARRRATSSAGSTPTPTAASTTHSTARSPTSSCTSSATGFRRPRSR